MAHTSKKDDVSSKLSNLTLKKANPARDAKPKKEIADSWEDEDVSSDDNDSSPAPATPTATIASKDTPASPPPPKSSTATHFIDGPPDHWSSSGGPNPRSESAAQSADRRRPEKTDAVARRLIAAGLGLKAPKQTDEQRAYQKAVREQERKRRDAERAEEEQRAKASDTAKAAMWDD